MNRLTTAAVLVAATSAFALTSALLATKVGGFSATRVVQLGQSIVAIARDASHEVGPPPSWCQRLVGVWTTLGFQLVIRPDDTIYDPGSGATGTLICFGQSVKAHWRRDNDQDERFTVSAADDRLTQSGAFLGVQYTRTARDIPPDLYGPPGRPVAKPGEPLDLSGL